MPSSGMIKMIGVTNHYTKINKEINMTTYRQIQTFSDDAYKSYVREAILNPMILQHNQFGSEIEVNKTAVTRLDETLDTVHSDTSSLRKDVNDLESRVFNVEHASHEKVSKFTDLDDTPRHLEAGKFLRVNVAGTNLEFTDSPALEKPVPSSFLDLSDTPSFYSGKSGQVVKVNTLENGLVFDEVGTPSLNFVDLQDTPSHVPANKMLRSDAYGSLIFSDLPSSGGSSEPISFTDLDDCPSTILADKMLVGSPTGSGLVFKDIPVGGDDSSTFLSLEDTPNSFTAHKWLKVNSLGTAVEFADAPSGGGDGGSTDLGPLTSRVEAVETKSSENTSSISGLESRVNTLENATPGDGGRMQPQVMVVQV